MRRFRWAGWLAMGVALLAVGGRPSRLDAQMIAGNNGVGGGSAFGAVNYGFSGLGPIPLQLPRATGTWAEVLTVTPNWLVLQNGQGQQFPVALDAIGVFLMRWPTSMDHVAPDALIEATGVDIGSNAIRTDHVDCYEGGARSLVTPTVQQSVGYHPVLTAYDVDQLPTYGARYFLLPAEEQVPNRIHVVGPIVGVAPLQVSIGGNNALGILPALNGLSMSAITPGAIAMVSRGDMVYLTVQDALPKSLAVSQLVVYKKYPIPR